MALRKEQILLLVALALGAWVWKGQAGAEWRVPTLTTTKLDYKVAPLPKAPLLTGEPVPAKSRRWFREPSETQPLPPRELPFPARPPAHLVALPLDPGPDLSRADLLLIPGDVVADVTLQPATAAAAAGPTATDPPPQGNLTREEKRRRFAKIYDEIKVDGFVHIGVLRVPDRDPFELERATDLGGVVVYLLEFSLEKEKLLPEVTFGSDPRQKIEYVKLADSLRNIVARKTREVPEATAYVAQRLELIDWLLLQARQDGSVYAEALHQVEVLKKSGAGLLADRAQARVCYARGDVAGEYTVYQAVTDKDGPAAAFRHEGLGSLESRLGLYEDAEVDLRRAVELQPTDARPHATLAMFLRQRGRPKEALAAANRALATAGTVVEVLERARILRNVVACRLGTGDIQGAREALAAIQLADWREADAFTSFLRASIDYADGKITEARDGFRTAATAGHGPLSQLGLAACQLRLGEWQDALAGFEAVADQAPLLRHRAQTGLALLCLRLGQNDQALAHVDRALEADPLDAYALYLRARAQAAQGQIASALEALAGSSQNEGPETAVLRLRDDFVPAVSMVADLRLRKFEEGEAEEQALDALKAIRYADRAVQLSAVPREPLFERQAIAHFRGADLHGAADAFAQARDAATDDPARLFAVAGLAVVDYAQEHVDEARAQLERMQEGLTREHPMKQWAADTMLKIDDHAHKEQLDDHFERDEPGAIWHDERDGALGPNLEDHHLVFRGKFSKAGAEVNATREKAVPKGGQFLAVGCRMQVGAGQGTDSFAGLRILVRGTAANEFRAEVGARDGKLFWKIQEGKEEPLQSPNTTDAIGTGVRQLELRVEERGDKQFRLLAVVDGAVVQRKDLTLLRETEGRELETALVVVSGSRPGTVDVRFDDYHLERRKD